MKEKNKYIRYPLDTSKIIEVATENDIKRINIFIDISSICKGFYNRETIYFELNYYLSNKKPSNVLILELKEYLNNLYKTFYKFDPFFILFYDNGYNLQNISIDPVYKDGRTDINTILEENEVFIFRKIKQHYFTEIESSFTKKDLSQVFYLTKYESDFVPYYCIMNNYFDGLDKDVLNIILSIDKDLLQTCKFKNTIQCITSFKAGPEKKFRIHFSLYDDRNAIGYFVGKKFQEGKLTAKFIPIILSICGDKSDKIKGISGIGPIRAYELVLDNRIPAEFHILKNNLEKFPKIISNHINLIEKNYKLISFDEQIKRLPPNLIN